MKNRKTLYVLLAVLLVTALSFAPALQNDFTTWDDNSHLYENVLIRSLSGNNLRQIFRSHVYQSYIPLTLISFAVEYHFFGYLPFVYHLNNLLLHLLVTALVFWLAIRFGISPWAAGWGALIFGVHPMHVESVAWVTERKDVLYSFFYLLSLHQYLTYVRRGRARPFVLSVVFGILAMLSKAMALSLPLIFLAIDWFQGRKFDRRILIEKIPHFLYVIPIAWLTYSLNARIPGNSFGEGFLVWVWTLIFYLRKFLVPLRLVPYYPLPQPISLGHWYYWIPLVSFGFLLTMLFWLRRKRFLVFSFLYFFLSIFFLLRFDNKVDTTVVSDRFMYLPTLGFCLFLGCAVDRVGEKIKGKGRMPRVAFSTALILLSVFLSARTFRQTMIWKDGVTLFDENVRVFPQDYLPYFFRAFALVSKGQIQEAVADYDKVVQLNPDYGPVYNDRGFVLLQMGKYQRALNDFNKAIKMKPRSYQGYLNRGQLYFELGRWPLALADYQKAAELDARKSMAHLKIAQVLALMGKQQESGALLDQAISANPLSAEGYLSRAQYSLSQGKVDSALSDLEKALVMDPSLFEAYFMRGNIFLQKQQWQKSIPDYTKAININGNIAELYSNRGLGYFLVEDYDNAIKDFNRALELNPLLVAALDNRAIIYIRKGLYQLAVDDFERSKELNPHNPATFFNLGLIYLDTGQWDRAEVAFQQTLEINKDFEAARQKISEIEQLKANRNSKANGPEETPGLKFLNFDGSSFKDD